MRLFRFLPALVLLLAALPSRAGDPAPHGQVMVTVVAGDRLPLQSLKSYVLARRPLFLFCYEQQLPRDPTLKGDAVVRFSVTPEGATSDVVAEPGALKDKQVLECLAAKVRAWKLPAKPEQAETVKMTVGFLPPQ